MLDRLVDFLLQVIGVFRFFEVLDEYQEGVMLRLGRFRKTVGPGIHWLIPLYIDRILTHSIAIDTISLTERSITTSDGVTVLCGCTITYRVKNIKVFLLEVDGAQAALVDSAAGTLRAVIGSSRWEELSHKEGAEKAEEELKDGIKKIARDFGIEVKRAVFSELAKARALRVAMDK